jgi:hypothetical protein
MSPSLGGNFALAKSEPAINLVVKSLSFGVSHPGMGYHEG